ncbi:MAG: hypothetical protein K0R46_56 [Herbinix sp.]|jgi:uncharacterized protein (DUF58 family)|nr:hypothetical protein [Herbinix sp.]
MKKGTGNFMLRNLIKYLVALAAVGLLSILYNTYYMGIIFLTLAAIPFFLFALLSYLYGRIKVELVSIIHVAKKGEVVPISVQIDNPTIFPVSHIKLYLTYKNSYSSEKYKKNFIVSVDANTKASVICNLYSEYAGNLEITLNSIRIYDYMRIFSLKKQKKAELAVAILPIYYELPQNQFAYLHSNIVESDYYSSVKSGDDPSEVFAIREYREGDRQTRIHWKLSRKLDQLMIKDFSDPLNCSVLLFVDLSIPDGINRMLFMDSILECALSLSYSFLLAGQLHYFTWYDEKHGASRRIRIDQEKDLFEAVDGLLHVAPYSSSIDALSAYQAEYPKEQYSNLIFITGEQPRRRTEALSLLKAMTRQVIYLGDIDNQPGTKYFPNEVIRRLSDTGVTLTSVDTNHVQRDMEQLRLD